MNVNDLVAGIIAGKRRSLAKAITLVESEKAEHRAKSEELFRLLLSQKKPTLSHRIGISGTPGVGKSTFIEAYGLALIAAGHKVAVIAVDPSSPVNGGSILGDKTRMELLGRLADAYIRPSPSRGSLGGIAMRSKEVILLLEAAGFSHIIVETVGVGQSEVAVASIVDTFLLLMQPGGGDSLQGIKRGVLELADLIVINKADGELLNAAKQAQREYRSALSLFRKVKDSWSVPVCICSSLAGKKTEKRDTRVQTIVTQVKNHLSFLEKDHQLQSKRSAQNEKWMWDRIVEDLKSEFLNSEAVKNIYPQVLEELKEQKHTATSASKLLLHTFVASIRK